jgi:uncharacterized protein YndB with AHSA1/START domain
MPSRLGARGRSALARISDIRVLLCAIHLAAAFGFGGRAAAAVVHASASGFELKQVVHIAAPPARVYAALIQPAKWWNSQHTYSGSAANLSLDARIGGCFCEALSGGGVVEHLAVVNIQPNQALELRGALGPFHARGVDGVLAFNLVAAGDGVDLTMTNDLGGYMSEGMDGWAPKADAMLADQLARLKRYVETGSP